MKQAQVHLALALERGTEPITGSVEDDHGHHQAFQGWMELAAALEALRNPPQSGSPDQASKRTD